MLGAGESGKSTIAKQLKILFEYGFSTEQRSSYKTLIFTNIVSSMKALVRVAEELYIDIEECNRASAKRVLETLEDSSLESWLVQDIKALWTDSGIQKCYSRSQEFQLNESAA